MPYGLMEHIRVLKGYALSECHGAKEISEKSASCQAITTTFIADQLTWAEVTYKNRYRRIQQNQLKI